MGDEILIERGSGGGKVLYFYEESGGRGLEGEKTR